MENNKKMKKLNKTAEYFYKLSYRSFLLGMPNFWIEDLPLPKLLIQSHPYIRSFSYLTFLTLIPFEFGAFVTQNDLSNKQESDRWIYCMAHPFLLMYITVTWRQQHEVQKWITQVLEMNAVYNDPQVEDQMVRKAALTSTVLLMSCVGSMVLHSTSALTQAIKPDGTFTTIITTWPLVNEVSTAADAVRVVTNVVWWVFVIRALCAYALVVSVTTCMSFQFKNLQSYFRSLEGIFQENLAQGEMERKFESGLKVGIRLHCDTFVCISRVKKICGAVLSGQVVFVIIILVFIMSQMLRSERTLVNAFATAITAAAMLVSTGLFLGNAGDMTIEAFNLVDAIYSSGWQNCRGSSSIRVRRLLVIAMSRAKKPIILKGLGIMDLSYELFLYLVKTSYSVFSVIF